MNLEIVVVSMQLLPGYGDENIIGPFEGVIVDAINLVDPAIKGNNQITHFNRTGQEVIDVVGCNNCLAIVDTDHLNLLFKKPVNQVNPVNLKEALEAILQLKYDGASGEYINIDGETVEINAQEGLIDFFPGFGFFNINLPTWGWALITGVSLLSFGNAKKATGKIIWGGIGFYAGRKTFNQVKNII